MEAAAADSHDHADDLRRWKAEHAELYDALRNRHAEAVARTRAELDGKWREWIRCGHESGARNAHAYSKLPQQWRPTVAETSDGGVAADPMSVLTCQRGKYASMWQADEQPGRYEWDERESLPRLTPTEIREASRLFKRRTAVSYDGVHCRHFSLLGDDALRTLAAVLEACELLGDFPLQCGLVVTPLLEKPKGGYRPVAIYSSLYRLWTKARRSVAQTWEDAHRREYFSASGGNGPLDTTWRQAVRQEASLAEGGVAASLLWDLEAFFEKVDRAVPMQRARDSSFPPAVRRLSLAAYSAPRVLALGGRISRELWAKNGVGAGCGLACTYVKIYTLAPMDSLVPKLPHGISIELHVDDFAITAEAPDELTAVRNITIAQEMLFNVIKDELGATVSKPEAALVASSCSLAHRIRAAVGELAGPIRQSAPQLGRRRCRWQTARREGRSPYSQATARRGLEEKRSSAPHRRHHWH